MKNLKKRCCECRERTWETCKHAWFFTFQWKHQVERGSLDVSGREEALKKFMAIKSAMMNGTYVKAKPAPAAPVNTERPMFATVAGHYEKDPEGLAKLSDRMKRQHQYLITFLGTVIVPPGIPFTEKPFSQP